MSSPRPAGLPYVLAVLAVLALLAPPLSRAEEGPIQDNSFLIEEAYNQEAGVIQHISTFARSARTGAWGASFTEEWPVLGQAHQASFTFQAAGPQGVAAGVGDLALNYRYQAVGSGETPLAFAPRLTVLVPTGDASRGLGAGGTGWQVNLPLSVVLAKSLVTHVNVGGTYVRSARVTADESAPATTLSAGQSLIWLAHQKVNLLVEALYTSTELAARAGTQRTESLTLNPGIRGAIDVAGGLQIVPGLSVPVGLGPSRGERSVFFYLSFEHPFRGAGPTDPRT
jgi:hypothetical protein